MSILIERADAEQKAAFFHKNKWKIASLLVGTATDEASDTKLKPKRQRKTRTKAKTTAKKTTTKAKTRASAKKSPSKAKSKTSAKQKETPVEKNLKTDVSKPSVALAKDATVNDEHAPNTDT